MIKYLDKPLNIVVYMKERYKEIFLENVIAIDFDDKHYRFYLERFNPKYIGDIETKVFKPDGQLGTLGLPYVFNKEMIYDIKPNYILLPNYTLQLK